MIVNGVEYPNMYVSSYIYAYFMEGHKTCFFFYNDLCAY